MASLPTVQAFVYEAVCAVELYLPVSERDIKLHVLTEMAASIHNWGECTRRKGECVPSIRDQRGIQICLQFEFANA